MADGILWARDIGASVTNTSIGVGWWWSYFLEMTYAIAKNAGVTHFAATGNDGLDEIDYPAGSSFVNAVGAVNTDGSLASFSNWGAGLNFTAPGVNIVTTDRVGAAGYSTVDYVRMSGTSFASPYAAGVAALMLSLNPSLSPSQVEQMMRASCIDLGTPGYDTTFGWGLVNANYSVQAARPGAWVDFDYCGAHTGTFAQPYNTFMSSIGSVPAGGNLSIKSGSTSETITIFTPMTIRAWKGPVIIGQQ
jgi:subtilisin family serine protease